MKFHQRLFERFTEKQLGILAAATTAFCWSFLAIILKVALNFTDSYTIVFYRMAFAALFMLMIGFFWQRDLLKILKHWPKWVIVAGLGLGGNYLGYMKGVELTSPSNAQVFIQLAPLSLLISGILFFKERPLWHQYVGILVTVFGFSLFFKDQAGNGSNEWSSYISGQTWIFFAAITWALFASIQKFESKRWTLGQLNLMIWLVASLLLSPGVSWAKLIEISWAAHLFLAFLGLNTIIAYGCFSYALKTLPATQVSPIITLNPLLTLLFMNVLSLFEFSWLAPEKVTFLGYFGALLVVSGVILAVRSRPLSFSLKKTST